MRKNGKTNAVGRGGALLRPAGYTELSKIFGESVCTYPLGRRGRCRSQPFATKERYGCGSAACRYTSARWEVTNSPQISIKTVQSAGPMRHPQASFEAQPRIARLLAPKIGIGPYKACTDSVRILSCFKLRGKRPENPKRFFWSLQGGPGEIEIPPGLFSFPNLFFWRGKRKSEMAAANF